MQHSPLVARLRAWKGDGGWHLSSVGRAAPSALMRAGKRALHVEGQDRMVVAAWCARERWAPSLTPSVKPTSQATGSRGGQTSP